jgi:membrane associated rhomboid family serine protease
MFLSLPMSIEKKRFYLSLLFPGLFLLIIWLIKIFETSLDLDFAFLGIYPLKTKGLIGILTAPLIHADYTHLFSNSSPILILGTGLFYFYNKIALKVFFLNYIITNVWIWLGARYAYHIGASGLVYSLASFLFFSGVFSKNMRQIAISLLVVFLYGSMVWGVFPIQPRVSWESHLMGAICGLVFAVYYRDQGPRPKKYSWELENENEDDSENEYWKVTTLDPDDEKLL